jgi:hypothetical protein
LRLLMPLRARRVAILSAALAFAGAAGGAELGREPSKGASAMPQRAIR